MMAMVAMTTTTPTQEQINTSQMKISDIGKT